MSIEDQKNKNEAVRKKAEADSKLYDSDSGSDTEPYDDIGPIQVSDRKNDPPRAREKRKAPAANVEFFGARPELAENRPLKLQRSEGYCVPYKQIRREDEEPQSEQSNNLGQEAQQLASVVSPPR